MADELTHHETEEIKQKILSQEEIISQAMQRNVPPPAGIGVVGKPIMGIGKLGDTKIVYDGKQKRHMGLAPEHLNHTVFPRQFRWTLKPEKHPNLEVWMRSVEHDMLNHTLKIEVFETQKLDTDKWLHELLPGGKATDDTLTLTAYDGMGNELYSLLFFKLRLKDHKCLYDYAKSDVVTHSITLDYGWYGKKIFAE